MKYLAFKKLTVYTVSMLLTFGPDLTAYAALPGGGKITSGKGSISVSVNTETIKQFSPTMSINWKSFNIGQGNTVNFKLPSSSSVVSNFVSGTSASQIAGVIDSNGKVFIFNPFGLVFLKSSSINVGAFLASGLSETSSTSTKMALSGTGSVSNAGTITVAPGGYVSLVGQNVTNTGSVNSLSGLITFGAGNSVVLDFSGNAILGLNVNSNTASSTINQGGVLTANGGTIVLKAGTATSLASSAINDSGMLEAETLNGVPGAITLKSGMKNGTDTLSGVIDASAPNGGNGGSITIDAGTLNMDITKPLNVSSAYGQNGTITIDPYAVSFGTAAGLENMDTNQSSYLADQITLTNNINLTGSGGVLYSWQPFGTSTNPFTGIFNGEGYTVSGFTIGTSSTPYTAHNNVGFFGDISSSATVENLNLSGSVYADNTTVIGANTFAASIGGILAGINNGTISNSTTAGVVQSNSAAGGLVGSNMGGASIVNSSSNATVTGTNTLVGGTDAGGLTGENIGSITESSATGSITQTQGVSAGASGGLVGYTDGGSITSSFTSVGTVSGFRSGGLIGYAYSGSILYDHSSENVSGKNVGGLVGNVGNSVVAITDSYATGNVSGTGNNAVIGGLAGVSLGSVLNSYATGSVTDTTGSSGTKAGGLVGDICGGTITNSYATGSVSALLQGSLAAMSASTVTINASFATNGGSSSGAGAYLVASNSATINNSLVLTSLNNLQTTQTDASGWAWNNSSATLKASSYPWFNLAGAAPVLVPDMSVVNVVANNATTTYSGQVFSSPTATITATNGATAPSSSAVSFGGTYLNATNAGSYTIVPTCSTCPTSSTPTSQNSILGTSYQNGILDITKKALTASGTVSGATKVYDNSASIALNTTNSDITLAGIVSGQTATYAVATGTFGSANAGTSTITAALVPLDFTAGSGFSWANYSLSASSVNMGTGSITKAPLSVSGVNTTSRQYNGTTSDALTGATISGNEYGNSLALTNDTTGILSNNGNAGVDSVSTSMGLNGTGASNFTLAQETGLTADISKAPLFVSNTYVLGQEYTGSNTATLTGATLYGNTYGQQVSLTGSNTGVFSNAGNAGMDSVTTNMGLTGAGSSNFVLSQPTGLSAFVTTRPLTLTSSSMGTLTVSYGTHDISFAPSNSTVNFSGYAPGQSLSFKGASAYLNYTTAGKYQLPVQLSDASFKTNNFDWSNYYVSLPTEVTGYVTVLPVPVVKVPVVIQEQGAFGIQASEFKVPAGFFNSVFGQGKQKALQFLKKNVMPPAATTNAGSGSGITPEDKEVFWPGDMKAALVGVTTH